MTYNKRRRAAWAFIEEGTRVRTGRAYRLVAVAAVCLGCSASTGPDHFDLAVQRSEWEAQHITSYQYDYLVTGYFIDYAEKPIRLTIRDDRVQAAVFVADSQSTLVPASSFPTIDQLFDRAEAASAAGTLTHITFDSRLHYPTEMGISGPPDGSGFVLASNLHTIQ
jgi:hypothetical protein